MVPCRRVSVGDRFARLVVLEEAERREDNLRRWRCRCDCGGEKTTTTRCLTGGGTQSCGCLQRERAAEAGRRRVKHGHTHDASVSAEYRAWQAMRQRCNNPHGRQWRYCGGRGIKVCKRWQHSFENFIADVGLRPSLKHSLDRINNDGNYEPGNVRWTTRLVQRHNCRKPGHKTMEVQP
jgi:hypothetical protein